MTYKILHMIGGGEIGGAEQHVLTLLTHLDTSTFSPYLVCLTSGPLAAQAESLAPTRTFRMRHPLDLTVLPSLTNWIRREGIDLIHTHGSRANLLGRLGAKILNLPCVTTVHSSLAHDYLSPRSASLALGLDRLTLPYTSKIIAVSQYLADEVSARGGKHLATIYNGQPPVPVADSGQLRDEFRKHWGIPEDALVLGTIGRLHPTKGQEYLIQAFQRLAQSFPKLHLLIIGDGPLHSKLESDLSRTGLSFTLTGFLPQAYQALPAMNIFILPSISEGMGLVLLEAMQMKIPVVASNVGGIPEAVRSGKDGLLVPPGDVSALSQACASLLENPDLANSLVSSASQRWQEFSIEKMVESTQAVYNSLLSRSSSWFFPKA